MQTIVSRSITQKFAERKVMLSEFKLQIPQPGRSFSNRIISRRRKDYAEPAHSITESS